MTRGEAGWSRLFSRRFPQHHDLGVDEAISFIDGYGLSYRRLRELSRYIKAFNILNQIPEIDRAVASKAKRGLYALRYRFSGVFDLYSIS